jgi:hypothetical protein
MARRIVPPSLQTLTDTFHVAEDGRIFNRYTDEIATHNHGKYLRVWFNGKKYYAHNVIWYLAHGVWPRFIDHRDGNRYNNRLSNLRECGMSQNIANADYGEFRGVEQHGRRFRVRIMVDGVKRTIGTYDTREEAAAAYRTWAEKHFGEYAFHRR